MTRRQMSWVRAKHQLHLMVPLRFYTSIDRNSDRHVGAGSTGAYPRPSKLEEPRSRMVERLT